MNDYFTFFYVKHFELPMCMKCAIQINLPCLALLLTSANSYRNLTGRNFTIQISLNMANAFGWIQNSALIKYNIFKRIQNEMLIVPMST